MALLPVARRFCLQVLSDGSRMQSLTIAAARNNLPCSPAMLITRQGWEIGLRIGRCLIVKDECIVKRFSQKRKLKT